MSTDEVEGLCNLLPVTEYSAKAVIIRALLALIAFQPQYALSYNTGLFEMNVLTSCALGLVIGVITTKLLCLLLH